MMPAGDLDMKTHSTLNGGRLLKLFCLFGAGLGLLISGCDHRSADPTQHNAIEENKKMKSAIATTTIHRKVPSLDLSQPGEIKTATFALG
jgi:hypothetical protein